MLATGNSLKIKVLVAQKASPAHQFGAYNQNDASYWCTLRAHVDTHIAHIRDIVCRVTDRRGQAGQFRGIVIRAFQEYLDMHLAIQIVQHHPAEPGLDAERLPLFVQLLHDHVTQWQVITGRGQLVIFGVDMHGDIGDFIHPVEESATHGLADLVSLGDTQARIHLDVHIHQPP